MIKESDNQSNTPQPEKDKSIKKPESPFARGGIVVKPTIYLLGDGAPELIIPLNLDKKP